MHIDASNASSNDSMGAHATDDQSADDTANSGGRPVSAASYLRPIPESRSFGIAELTLELQHFLDLGPGENPGALRRVANIVARLRKVLPESHFREERLRDLSTDFSLWFSKGPRLQFDYNDEALRSMLQVDIHRLKSAG